MQRGGASTASHEGDIGFMTSHPHDTSAPGAMPAGGAPTIPNRLLGVGDIVSGSFRTVFAAPRIFLGLPLLVAIGLAVPGVVLFSLALASGLASDRASVLVGLIGVAVVVFGFAAAYVLLRMTGALVVGAYRIALGERPSMGQVWRDGAGVVWRMIVLALIFIASYLAIIIAIVVIVVLLSSDLAGNAGNVGSVIFILGLIPAFYWITVRLVFIFPVLAIERTSPVASIGRSLALTKGSWWMTFGRILMLGLLTVPVLMLLSALTAPLELADSTSGDASARAAWGVGAAVAAILSAVLNVVFQVYSFTYVTLMYIDARRREQAPAVGGPPQDRPVGPGSSYPYGAPGPSGIQPYPGPRPMP